MVFKIFPALFEKPQNIKFSEQEANEEIDLFLRQHPIVNTGWIFLSILALGFPVILLQLDLLSGLNILSTASATILIGFFIIYYLLILGYVAEQFLHWYFNIYLVTNIHLVDVDFESLLYRNIKELNLSDIEAVSSKMSGIASPLFNYGDVIIETAAAHQAATFLKVPRPDFVADRIEDLRVKKGEQGGGP
jgi:hypothetical protein